MLIVCFNISDLELSKLDDKLIQILAWQRLQQLMPSKNSTDLQRKNSGSINGLLTTPGMGSIFSFQIYAIKNIPVPAINRDVLGKVRMLRLKTCIAIYQEKLGDNCVKMLNEEKTGLKGNLKKETDLKGNIKYNEQ